VIGIPDTLQALGDAACTRDADERAPMPQGLRLAALAAVLVARPQDLEDVRSLERQRP